MTFFSEAMNGVKAYFKRTWRKRDIMTLAKIPVTPYKSLRKVYRTLFWAMLCSTVGSYLHLFWEVGGMFTVLSSVASLLCLYFTSPQSVMKRISLLMIAAFSFGASLGLFTEYLFGIDQVLVASLFGGSTIGIGTFWSGAMVSRQRSIIYLGCLIYSCGITFCSLVVNASDILDSRTAHRMLMVTTVLSLFMGYVVVYSQEILYDAQFRDINFVNRTLTIFFRLPVIVVHAARLYLGARTEKRRRHKIAWGIE